MTPLHDPEVIWENLVTCLWYRDNDMLIGIIRSLALLAILGFAPGAYQEKYDLRGRKAITSGAMNEAVPAESVFFKYLADQLQSNQSKYMSAGELFRNLEFPVSNNSPNSPQYGTIQNVNDTQHSSTFMMAA